MENFYKKAVKRGRIFYLSLLLGFGLISSLSFFFSLPYASVLCGMATASLNMEMMIRFVILNKIFLLFKYAGLILLLYFLIPYVEGGAFLLGLSFVFSYLIGLSLEVLL